MERLLQYSLESAACIAVFTLFYYLLLRKERFFATIRYFFLFAMVFAVVIPALQLSYGGMISSPAGGGSILEATLQQASSFKNSVIPVDAVTVRESAPPRSVSLPEIFFGIYLAGIVAHMILFGWKLARLVMTIHRSEKHSNGKYCFVFAPEASDQVYSFFRFIFIARENLDKEVFTPVIDHEKTHGSSLHSLDLMVTELLIVFQWFNPFVYLLRKAVVENHEFEADRSVIRSRASKVNYLRSILNQWVNHHYLKLTSAFSHSLSKKRLLMLTGRETTNFNSRVKLLAVIPMTLLLFFFIACSEEAREGPVNDKNKKAIAFQQVTKEKVGQEIPRSLYQKYHQQINQKGERILFELYSEFEGKEYPRAFVRMEKHNVYGIHLYNYGSERTTSHIEITDTSGHTLKQPHPEYVGWLKEKTFYIDLMTASGPHQITIRDSKNRANKIVLVMTVATSLDTLGNKEKDVYMKPDQMPLYDGHGSLADFREDVIENVEYPERAREENLDGMVYVTFVVNQEGFIEEKEIMKGAHPLLNKAALEGLEGLPKWNPGMEDGKPVKTRFTIPVIFKL